MEADNLLFSLDELDSSIFAQMLTTSGLQNIARNATFLAVPNDKLWKAFFEHYELTLEQFMQFQLFPVIVRNHIIQTNKIGRNVTASNILVTMNNNSIQLQNDDTKVPIIGRGRAAGGPTLLTIRGVLLVSLENDLIEYSRSLRESNTKRSSGNTLIKKSSSKLKNSNSKPKDLPNNNNAPTKSSPKKSSQKYVHAPEGEPRPKTEYVDNLAAFIELHDLMEAIFASEDNEQRLFGENAELLPRLRNLVDQIEPIYIAFADIYRSGIEVENNILTLSDYYKLYTTWTDEFKSIKERQIALGRRCRNSTDPLTLEEINDISDAMFIRLDNGDCWDILSLLDYIKSGKSPWTSNNELNRILKHPEAIRSGFSAWYSTKAFGEHAKNISEKTLAMMVKAASLLYSIGPDFDTTLKNTLTTAQFKAYKKANFEIENVSLKLREEIIETVKTVLKSQANVELWTYFQNLSQKEKDSLKVFDPDLEKNIKQCHDGNICVYQLGTILLDDRNAIAKIKGLKPINFNNHKRFD